ncbi:MAG: glycosyltransferase family 10 [Planctomycetota bacterium]
MTQTVPTHDPGNGPDPIAVKFVIKGPIREDKPWRRQFPGGEPVFGRCRFTFDPEAREYDWLIIYDELPTRGETLACPRANTLLVTTEPPSIKVYGSAYLKQFGHVLTSQEPWALKHPGRIYTQPALRWYFGLPLTLTQEGARTYEQIKHGPHPPKDALIATVCSSKAMGHTLHRLRYDFTMALKQAMPELDLFGRGIQDITDKAEAIDRHKYHVAIENHIAPHHITEKLTDAYLGGALPFYFGAPNAADYFPEDSFIPIDIRKTDRAIATIRQAIADNAFEKRQAALAEAKRRTLEEQNLFAVLAREIERLDTGQRGSDGAKLINRRVFRNRNPIGALRYLIERYTVQAKVRKATRG